MSIYRSMLGKACLFGLLAVLILTGCASQGMTRSGYLTDYDGMQRQDSKKEEAVAISPESDLSLYSHAMIMPVIYAGKTTDEDEKKDFQKLTLSLERQLQEKFTQRFMLTSQPAPNVLIVRAAITDVTKAKPVANVLTTALVFSPLFNGGMSGEAELLDAVTGQQLRAITWADEGSVWRLKQMKGSFSQTGHAEYLTGVFAGRIFSLVTPHDEKLD